MAEREGKSGAEEEINHIQVMVVGRGEGQDARGMKVRVNGYITSTFLIYLRLPSAMTWGRKTYLMQCCLFQTFLCTPVFFSLLYLVA